MDVHNAETAERWLQAWERRAFQLGRVERLIQDMRGCASTCELLQPERAAEFRAAARHLEAAKARHEARRLTLATVQDLRRERGGWHVCGDVEEVEGLEGTRAELEESLRVLQRFGDTDGAGAVLAVCTNGERFTVTG